jgi:hypothetical protein
LFESFGANFGGYRNGNPNYAPMTGLISKSMRARLAVLSGGAGLWREFKVFQRNTLLDSDLRNRILNPMMEERNPFTHRNKIRPGLNVFDKEGNELEWDFEHDTRFYDESVADDGVEKRTAKPSLF